MFIKSLFRYSFIFSLFFISWPLYSLDLKTYVGGSLKAAFPLDFYQMGWTGDELCYPEMKNCQTGHKGYFWLYRLSSKLMNPGLGAYAGVYLNNNWRLEVSSDLVSSLENTSTKALGLYYLKKNERPFSRAFWWDDLEVLAKAKDITGSLNKVEFSEKAGDIVSVKNSFSQFQLITALLHLYYDFPQLGNGFKPYVGAGFGYAFVGARISYSSDYKENSSLNSRHKGHFLKEALAGRLSAGINSAFSKDISYGLKADYTAIGEVSQKLKYDIHPNQKSHLTLLKGIRYWTVSFNLTYFL